MLDLLKKPIAEPANLPLSKIRIDGGTQMRMGLNPETVAEYTEAINGGARLPPPIVFHDGNEYWLGDGFHRVEAYKRVYNEIKVIGSIEVDVRVGTRRDAVLFAAGANASHGLRRTAADKERSVDTLLRDEEWAGWSDREIAKRCNVSPTFVGNRRKLLNPDGTGERTYQTKHGTVATMNTAKIGKVEFAPKELDLADCIALVWRTVKFFWGSSATSTPAQRATWLKRARMKDFWDQLAHDEARPADGLILEAIAKVEAELNGQIEHDRRVAERPAQLAPRYIGPADKAAQAKEQREGMTKREYAVRLMPGIIEWLRTYTDKHGRGWREIADVASHSSSLCWADISRAWNERGIYYEEDTLKAAIELSILQLQQEDAALTVHVDSEASDEEVILIECPQCGQAQADHDGFGVLHCEPCGYCTHASVTGGVCGFCGQVIGKPFGDTHGGPLIETIGEDPRCSQLQRLLTLYQQVLDSGDEYGQLTGHFSHTPPLRRVLEPMLAEVQSTMRALCAVEV